MNSKSGPSLGTVALVSLICGALAGGVAGYLARGASSATGGITGSPGSTAADHETIRVLDEDSAIERAVELADPAVVKVVTQAVLEYRPRWDYFYGAQPRRELVEGLGSGFLFRWEDDEVYILTNHHVVASAERVYVKLQDGRELPVSVLGSDSKKDVAVLKLEQALDDPTILDLGDSAGLKTGQRVIAIGHPYDYEHTVTVGYVSAIGYRQVGPDEGEWRNLIQTDAAINHGNSGGPLIDLAGNVVGVNSMIFSPADTGNIGIGFAVPVDEAKELLYFLIKGGPWVGIKDPWPNSPGLARALGLTREDGVVVQAIYRGSPADEAGIEPADVITAVDGAEITTPDELRSAILKHRIGDKISFTVHTKGQPDSRVVETEGARVPDQLYRDPGG